MEIKRYTKDQIRDVIAFEQNLRKEENVWGWEIDDTYLKNVTQSFEKTEFDNSVSMLAYIDGEVVGRIDSSMIYSHFDGSVKAYLDWICVLKSCRQKGVAQALMNSLQRELKKCGVDTLMGLIDSNEEAQRFYRSMPNALIRDEGIWIHIT